MPRLTWLAFAALSAAAGLGCATPGPGGRGASSPSIRVDDAGGLELILVRGGCYQMGADPDDCDATPEERPAHEVCVGTFFIGRHEVTQGQWRAVTGGDTRATSTCARDDCPVDNVSWGDVQTFLGKLNARGGVRYRLPTEAEWEYAARSGGKAERYAGGADVHLVAWNADNSGKVNHPVGRKAPNGLGLYDMSGNVWEMTSDWFDSKYYSTSPRDDPRGPDSGKDHVVRGGCRTGGPANQRTTRRTYIGDRTKGLGLGGNVGFRLVRDP